MNKIAQRAKAIADAKAIKELAKSEGRGLSAEELASMTAFLDKAEEIQAAIVADGDAAKALASASAQGDRLENALNTLEEPNTPESTPATAVIQSVKELALDEPTYGFNDMGDFATAVFNKANGNGNHKGLDICAAASGMNQSNPSDGGSLVPPQFSQNIWDGLNRAPNSLLSMTENFNITGESLTIPANAETSRKTGSRYGGIQAYWLGEADQKPKSRPKLRDVKLEPFELAVFVYVTDRLLRNGGRAVTQYMNRAAIDEINFMTGDAIYEGDGVGKPMGLLNSNSLITVAKESGQAAATIVSENINNMWARLHPNAKANAVWLINPDVAPALQQLKIDVGTGGQALFIPPTGIAGAPFGTLKGRPIMEMEFPNSLGTAGDIMLVDMRGYTTGTRAGIMSDMSIHLRFDFNETAFRFVFEVDGQPWLNSALTPFKGTNTLSTHVALATRT